MSEDAMYITPLDIREYVFCPYIMYLKKVLGFEEPVTELMEQGRTRYMMYKDKSRRQKTLLGLKSIKPDEIKYNIDLFSRKYRVYGIADAIYRRGRDYYVLEIKHSKYRGEIPRSHVYQALSYAIMYEEETGKIVSFITFYYSINNKMVVKKITKPLRNRWIKIVCEIWKTINGKLIPRPLKHKRKCEVCFYKNICIKE